MSEGGKQSRESGSLDADSITKSGRIGVPGKITKTQSLGKDGPTGDDYVDHGAVCDDKASSDCFLNGQQRARLIDQLSHRIAEASTNYKIAAQAARVDKLVAEEEELPLGVFILLDLVTLHSVLSVSHSLAHLKGGSVDSLKQIAAEAKAAGTHADDRWYQHAMHAIGSINDEHIKDNIENAIDGVKERARHGLQRGANREESGAKAEAATFLDLLTDQAALGFATVRERVPATASDAELVTLWQAFAVENHLVSQYKAALVEKLERYEKSGVTQVAKADAHPEWGMPREDKGGYVIWNVYLSGHPKELIYEHGGMSYSAKDQLAGKPAGRRGGQVGVGIYDGNFRGHTVTRVPDEFIEVAIMRHQKVWGMPVATQVIDDSDPLVFGEKRAQAAQDNKAKQRPTTTPAPGQLHLGTGPTTPTPIQPYDAPTPGGDR